ncbi:hypothetical protein QBC46DRAFT_274929 [Diplogelasinospora grovesii]|uniref:N-acetyltransferase domain-containing protein n=1 Tax=Diplogelasinospora grovesii TaxID=303347 RepID=A0AAN6MWK1_9PEZI|nr:hypothetical protein QBC46DRAFT_274929 [Diplogelasinospora grovesii]
MVGSAGGIAFSPRTTRQIRKGVPSDVDAVTNVMIQAMPGDPQWNWRFPYRPQYPKDHIQFTKLLVGIFLDPKYDDWHVMVSEVSGIGIVSFSVWNVSCLTKRKHGPGDIAQDPAAKVEELGGNKRRDAHHARCKAFREQQIRASKKFFEQPVLHLQILGTLREHRRQGHGKSLCKWGMNLVREEGLEGMSVMASPMGRELYTSLHFRRVGNIHIQVGDENGVHLEAMMYRVVEEASECGLDRVPSH